MVMWAVQYVPVLGWLVGKFMTTAVQDVTDTVTTAMHVTPLRCRMPNRKSAPSSER